MLTAGFYVASGVATGPKTDTTIAFSLPTGASSHPSSPRLLDQIWLTRWRHSSSQFPEGLPPEEKEKMKLCIESHPQFTDHSNEALWKPT